MKNVLNLKELSFFPLDCFPKYIPIKICRTAYWVVSAMDTKKLGSSGS